MDARGRTMDSPPRYCASCMKIGIDKPSVNRHIRTMIEDWRILRIFCETSSDVRRLWPPLFYINNASLIRVLTHDLQDETIDMCIVCEVEALHS